MATRTFPDGFLWGAATAGHQVEGDSDNSDTWFLEQQQPSVFREPSGKACNSWELWEQDLELVNRLGLNAYRFSIEWARVEPRPGEFSGGALADYEAMVDRCRDARPGTRGHLQSLHGATLVRDARGLSRRRRSARLRQLLHPGDGGVR